MPKCPECREEIDYLEMSYSAISTYKLKVADNEEKETFIDSFDDEFIDALCPNCAEELFTSKKAAIEFLRG